MKRTKAFRRFQREKRIRKYRKLCNYTWFSARDYEKTFEALGRPIVKYTHYGKGKEAREAYEENVCRSLARTHTRCSCYRCQRSRDFCGPSINDRRKLQISSDPEDYE